MQQNKKTTRKKWFFIIHANENLCIRQKCQNLCALNSAGLQTCRANVQFLRCPVHCALHTLYICIPYMIRSSVRVADIVPKVSTLSANITSCHLQHLLLYQTLEYVSVTHPQRSYSIRLFYIMQALFFLFSHRPKRHHACFPT